MKKKKRLFYAAIAILALCSLSLPFPANGFTNRYCVDGHPICPEGGPVHENITRQAMPFLKSEVLEGDIVGDSWTQSDYDGLVDQHQYVDTDFPFASEYHFDGCNFTKSVRNINDHYRDALTELNPHSYSQDDAVDAFGELLHTVQDFYSHSNWVESDVGDLFEKGYDFWREPVPFEMYNGVYIIQGEDRNIPKDVVLKKDNGNIINVFKNNIFVGKGLISGVPWKKLPDDCPDSFSVSHDALNKDREGTTDSLPLHSKAKERAIKQTTHEWCRLVNLVNNRWHNEGVLKLFDDWVEDKAAALAACASSINIALIIDETGSMSTNDPNGRRRDAAKVLVDTAQPGNKIAVVGFYSSFHTLAPLTSIFSDTDRTALKKAIDSISELGSTNINAGLDGGFQELSKDSTTNNNSVAILLTDGQQTDGSYNDQSHEQYHQRNWRVYTVGLGADADAALLQRIADETGGQYRPLSDPKQLTQLYFDVLQGLVGGKSALKTSLPLKQGDQRQIPINLPYNQTLGTFFTTWPGSEVSMRLISPSGRVIEPSTASWDVSHAKGSVYELFSVRYPEAGKWMIDLYGTSLPQGEEEVGVRVAMQGASLSYLPVAINSKTSGSSVPTPTATPPSPTMAPATPTTTSPSPTMAPATPTATPQSTPTVPQGAIAFVSTRNGNEDIYVMNTDGSNQQRLTKASSADNGPSWSPDGGKIAFSSDRDGNFEIYVMNADGSNPKRLTNSAAVDRGPVWSPDGSKMAFSTDRDGNREIYVMNADGSGQQRLTVDSADDREPSWSPDGKRIAFRSYRSGNDDIYVMNADGTNLRNLTSNAADDREPAWSPDGASLLFTSDRDGDFDIYAMGADGSNPRNVTNNSADDTFSAWSPDGKIIAFSSTRDSSDREIYIMNADGSGVRRLTTNTSDDHDPSWNSKS